ncbi:thiamine ABC transporter substrate binding subunit [Paracoccus sp. S1E-3]|uniref:thiamine ABC transporter substrate-binding protein n=1 Tax=Paracoccus sp. S1E-3 TaxID=2756130 RepID=UPI0015EE92D2|nr:thiamine ABC transporter substrate binding subunit [Paracoccus sp. S1E-3]MBA4492137.1 thiamine ABC transporter substrate-binding protein [Paracoccus sp. S1E-3]
MRYPALALLTGALTAATPVLAAGPEFTVYAPDYFASEWGPGPKIEAGFEKICGCDLVLVTGDVLPRILLEGDRTKADVVIGLNTDVTLRARESGLFAPHGQDLSGLTMPVTWTDDTFLPFNWSEIAFIYDANRLKNPPATFQDLLDAPDDLKILIQDPRSSVSGLAMLLWVKSVYGDKALEAWQKLRPKVLTVTPGWSESYGMFTDGEADMVLSFTTSPAYHIGAEQDTSKRAAIFPEGHYFMAELAARLKSSDQPELAEKFMEYVLSPDFQGMIAEANWSYPSKLARDQLPAYFAALDRPERTIFLSETEAEALRKPALEEWLSVFAQ